MNVEAREAYMPALPDGAAAPGTGRPYLTLAEVADLLAVDPRSVRRWAEQDASFPATRLGPRLVRVERQALDRWLTARTQRVGRRTARICA